MSFKITNDVNLYNTSSLTDIGQANTSVVDENTLDLAIKVFKKDKRDQKTKSDNFDYNKVFNVIPGIDEIIISYLDCSTFKRNSQPNEGYLSTETRDVKDIFDDVKAFLAIGHLTKREDLKVIAYILNEFLLSTHTVKATKLFDEPYAMKILFKFYDPNDRILESSNNFSLIPAMKKHKITYLSEGEIVKHCRNALNDINDYTLFKYPIISPHFRILHDTIVIKTVIRLNGQLIFFAPQSVQDDQNMMFAAIRKSYKVLSKLNIDKIGKIVEIVNNNQNLKDSTSLVISLLKHDHWIFQHLGPLWKENFEIVMHAVKLNGILLQFASPIMRRNPEIVNAALNDNEHAIQYVDAVLLQKDPQLQKRFDQYNGKDSKKS